MDSDVSYYNSLIASAGLAGKIWILAEEDGWGDITSYAVDRDDSLDTQYFGSLHSAFTYVVDCYPSADWDL